jgi:hypothetical protein
MHLIFGNEVRPPFPETEMAAPNWTGRPETYLSRKESRMGNSPCKSPQVDDSSRPRLPAGSDRAKLRAVAKYQRWAIFALLANPAVFVVGINVADWTRGPVIWNLVPIAMLTTATLAVVPVFLLVKKVSDSAVGAVLCAMMMCVPCICVLFLLIASQMATSYLQQHGVKVGFLGINPNRI